MNTRTALVAHSFPIVVEALAAIVARAGYAVARAGDVAAVLQELGLQPDLAVIGVELDDAAVRQARNGATRTLVLAASDDDGAVALTAPVERLIAAIGAVAPPRGPALTPRERDIARLVAAGQRNRVIATGLGISEGTVKMHLHNVYTKLGLQSRTQLAMAAGSLTR